nr:hypothetical protein CFP56_16228 [Quercus suber]
MAAPTARSNRQSYMLTVTPIDFSLTAGTDIPPPEEDFSTSFAAAAPPVADGGPLTSHPTTPDEKFMPGAWPTERRTTSHASKPVLNNHNYTHNKVPPSLRNDSFRTSDSPDAQRRPSTAASGVRRLFSLGNLRTSFSSSRTSLMLPAPRSSNDSAFFDGSSGGPNSLKRPSSPSVASSYSSFSRPSEMRSTRSRNWFKRKSSMLLMSDRDVLDAVDEDRRPETRDSKRLKPDVSDAPLLPEVSALGGGGVLNDGEIGWDATLFKQ